MHAPCGELSGLTQEPSCQLALLKMYISLCSTSLKRGLRSLDPESQCRDVGFEHGFWSSTLITTIRFQPASEQCLMQVLELAAFEPWRYSTKAHEQGRGGATVPDNVVAPEYARHDMYCGADDANISHEWAGEVLREWPGHKAVGNTMIHTCKRDSMAQQRRQTHGHVGSLRQSYPVSARDRVQRGAAAESGIPINGKARIRDSVGCPHFPASH